MEEQIKQYKIIINADDETSGVDMISLVDRPAIGENFLIFSEAEDITDFKFKSEWEQILTGPALIPDLWIDRVSNGQKYQVTFDADTIKVIRDKFFKFGFNKNINMDHRFPVDKTYVVEAWIITEGDNRAESMGFKKLPVGTLMLSIKVEDENFWNEYILSKKIKGFSVEVKTDKLVEVFNDSKFNEVYTKYFNTINMSYSELLKWAETEDSKKYSRNFLFRNLELLDINKSDWEDKHIRWAEQIINNIENNIDSDNYIRLKNLGLDINKMEFNEEEFLLKKIEEILFKK
jgi:hypothetical protein